MKYFSDVLNDKFDTVEALEEAEAKYEAEIKAEKERKEALSNERKARAAEIEDLIKQRAELDAERAKLDKAINEKVDAFAEDYGYFHCAIKSSGDFPITRPWFDSFFDHWFNFKF